MRQPFFLSLALAVGCNSVLGIDAATLCSGTACGDAGPGVLENAQPNLPGAGAAAADAGTDASVGLSGAGGSEAVVQPGVTPVDTSGVGAGNGGGSEGGDAEGPGSGEEGPNDGENDDQDGDGDDPPQPEPQPAPAPEPSPPAPPPPPPSPCAGLANGEAFCDGATRIACGPGGAVLGATPCASAAHCQEGTGPACAVCLTGEALCEGATLLACNATHTGVDTIPCAGPAQCNAAQARCEVPTCAPSQLSCDGSVLQVCNATLTGFDPLVDCGVPAACNAQTGSCIICTPGTERCIDALTLGTCDPSGQFEVPSACGALEVCLNGECTGLDGLPGLPGL